MTTGIVLNPFRAMTSNRATSSGRAIVARSLPWPVLRRVRIDQSELIEMFRGMDNDTVRKIGQLAPVELRRRRHEDDFVVMLLRRFDAVKVKGSAVECRYCSILWEPGTIQPIQCPKCGRVVSVSPARVDW